MMKKARAKRKCAKKHTDNNHLALLVVSNLLNLLKLPDPTPRDGVVVRRVPPPADVAMRNVDSKDGRPLCQEWRPQCSRRSDESRSSCSRDAPR